ncbi:MAG: hydrogenase expression/formation protein HypE [Eubacteriales bacterium]|nr:hydrogenase expression/formation protein HypE [Eubacteriales bacterium]MDN5364008.1 hydrogenase expression/formation protein HypE [Eubacteriales bacterium]
MADRILLAHGSGGKATLDLLREVFYPEFGLTAAEAGDAAVLRAAAGRLAITTDSFVITPLFFPGGDIGKLAFCGTVNDLAAVGAEPVAITAAFIIEEGLEVEVLKKIAKSLGEMARATGIPVVAGDTKVVEKGKADGLFITTTGLGIVPEDIDYNPARIKPGDVLLVSGTIGDHGWCIMALREGIDVGTPVTSDCRPLHRLVGRLAPLRGAVRTVRDATRGGLGAVLNEWALQSGATMIIREAKIPVREEVRGGCRLLGLDPLYLANEGKMVVAVAPEKAEEALTLLREDPDGKDAAIIGEVAAGPARVVMVTEWGTERIVPLPRGEIVPRIC